MTPIVFGFFLNQKWLDPGFLKHLWLSPDFPRPEFFSAHRGSKLGRGGQNGVQGAVQGLQGSSFWPTLSKNYFNLCASRYFAKNNFLAQKLTLGKCVLIHVYHFLLLNRGILDHFLGRFWVATNSKVIHFFKNVLDVKQDPRKCPAS